MALLTGDISLFVDMLASEHLYVLLVGRSGTDRSYFHNIGKFMKKRHSNQ